MLEGGSPEHGVTAVVNRHGALLLSPVRGLEGATLWLRNELTRETVCGRITWIGSIDSDGCHKLGVEFVEQAPNFWGVIYEEALKTVASADPSTSALDASGSNA